MADINEKLAKFCANIDELESMVASFAEFHSDLNDELDDKDNVWKKLDTNITHCFANTSLYWLYLTLKDADNLDGHPIKNEIDRVRKYMQSYMLLKQNAPKLNIKVAQNFIRHGLGTPQDNNNNKRPAESCSETSPSKRSRD